MQWMTSDWMVFPWIQFDVRDANSRQVSCVEFENQNDWNDGIEFLLYFLQLKPYCVFTCDAIIAHKTYTLHTWSMGNFACAHLMIFKIFFSFLFEWMECFAPCISFIRTKNETNILNCDDDCMRAREEKKIWMWILNGACTHSWEIKDSFWLNEWQSFTVRRRLHFPHSKTRKLVASRKLLPHNCRRSEERHDTNEWTANINKQSWWRWHWCENEYFDNIRQLSEELRSDVSLWVFHIEQTSSTELEKKCWRKKITNVVCERRKSIIVAAFASKTLFFRSIGRFSVQMRFARAFGSTRRRINAWNNCILSIVLREIVPDFRFTVRRARAHSHA